MIDWLKKATIMWSKCLEKRLVKYTADVKFKFVEMNVPSHTGLYCTASLIPPRLESEKMGPENCQSCLLVAN